MQLDVPARRALNSNLLEWLALLVWIIIAVAICVRVFLAPEKSNLYTSFAQAARNWQQGENPYDARFNPKDFYRYPPSGTVLFIPFTIFPDRLGSVLWRLVNFAIFLGGFACWCRAVFPAQGFPSRTKVALLWLLLFPLSLASLNNGQPNGLIAGLLLAAVAAAARERWSLAAVCAALPVLLKVYPIALGLLLVLMYPRQFSLRFLAALLLGLALPFLCQHYDFVLEQHQKWLQLLGTDGRRHESLYQGYRDLWLVLKLVKIPIATGSYLFIQLGMAGLAGGLCLAGRLAGLPRSRLLLLATSQAICWMILCGPATEWPTYILLAPVLAWSLVEAWHAGRSPLARTTLLGVGGFFCAQILVRMFPWGKLWLWQLLPFAALVLFFYFLVIHIREIWVVS